LAPNIDDVLPHKNVSWFLNSFTNPKLVPRRGLFICRSSYTNYAMQVGKSISWLGCTVESKDYVSDYDVVGVR